MSIRGFLTPSAGLALLATLGFSGPAQAWDALPAYNQGTLARAFALPVIGQSRVLNASQSAFSADYDVTTEYYVDANASESITIDGETSAFSLGWRQGLADGLELTARLPVLVIGGGYMDHFVNEWHKAFGLPDGGRPLAQDNQRQITYTASGNTVLDERRSGTTLGDIQLGAGYRLGEGAALRGVVKLPTGSKHRLTGGNWGGALWGDFALPFDKGSSFDGFASLGVSIAAQADALPGLQRRAAVFGGAGLGYRLTQNFELRSQLYAHSALYQDTGLSGLKKPGLQLTLGGSYRCSSSTRLDVFFQEDAVTNSSPDFSLHLGLSYR